MERYSSYKDSGEKWLGEIPGHWEIRKAKYLWNESDLRSEYGSEQLLSVSQYDGVRESKEESRSESLKGYKMVAENDLVINIMLAWLGGLGVSSYNGLVSPAYCVYKMTDEQDSRFLHYLYRTPLYLAEFARRSSGIVPSRWRMYTDDFGQVLTILPPLPEQRAIVTYLDRVTGDIDRAIEESQKMIDLLNERKQIIIQHAVTKGLNNNAKLKYSGVEWIGEVPEGWECLPLKRCVTFINTKAQEHDKPRISLENIESWTGRYVQTESQYEGSGIQFLKNDILFGKLRPYLAKVYLSQMNGEALGDFWVLRANERVTPQYLQQILLSHQFIYLVDSSTYGAKMPRADWKTNSKIMIPIPTIAEQADIVEHISKHCENISQAIASAERKIALLRERKQIIINEVVTGKVKVS